MSALAVRILFAICFVTIPLKTACAQDFAAIERRLGNAVGDGEINLRQANLMMEALKSSVGPSDSAEIEQRLKAAGTKLKAAVLQGQLTESEANQKWAEMERQGKQALAELRLRRAVAAGEISENQARDQMQAIRRRSRANLLAEQIRQAVAAGKLTPDQAEKKLTAIAGTVDEKSSRDKAKAIERLRSNFLQRGITDTMLSRAEHVMEDHRFDADQIRQSLGAMLRVIAKKQTSNDAPAEFGDRTIRYLEEEVGLEIEQIDFLQGLTQRVARQLTAE